MLAPSRPSLRLLLVPGIAGPGQDIARSEIESLAELLLQPGPPEREERIFMEPAAHLVHFEERLVEPLEPRLEDLAGVGR